jgi:hypothetical protein
MASQMLLEIESAIQQAFASSECMATLVELTATQRYDGFLNTPY